MTVDTPPSRTPYELAEQAAIALAEQTGIERHDVALVLGSGWLPAVDALGEATTEISTTDLPGFSAAAVAGHSGKIRSVRSGDKQLLVFLSRTHFYEGKGVAAVVHGVRTAANAGCRAIVLTNGCGGLKETWTPGTPVLISDHINLTGRSPIEGANFVDLTDLYSSRLRKMCREVDPSLDEGVYVQFPGPHYETPAEIGMARVIGGHLAGMSTTLEAIAAREAGMEILGISLVTNLAAGLSGEPLNHEEVLEAGKAAASRMGELLSKDRAPDLTLSGPPAVPAAPQRPSTPQPEPLGGVDVRARRRGDGNDELGLDPLAVEGEPPLGLDRHPHLEGARLRRHRQRRGRSRTHCPETRATTLSFSWEPAGLTDSVAGTRPRVWSSRTLLATTAPTMGGAGVPGTGVAVGGGGGGSGTGGAGGATTNHPTVAGVPSTRPTGSMARTRTPCVPIASWLQVRGEVQATKGCPSRLHSKVEPGSSEVNCTVADVLTVSRWDRRRSWSPGRRSPPASPGRCRDWWRCRPAPSRSRRPPSRRCCGRFRPCRRTRRAARRATTPARRPTGSGPSRSGTVRSRQRPRSRSAGSPPAFGRKVCVKAILPSGLHEGASS